MGRREMVMLWTDIGLAAVLLLLMSSRMIGQTAHEWLGIAAFVLCILHHVWNRNRTGQILRRGVRSPLQILQTALVLLLLVCVIGSAVSAVIISRQVFSFLPIRGGQAAARTVHMLCAYWGFVLVSLHAGTNGRPAAEKIRRAGWKAPAAVRWLVRILLLAAAAYGVPAFVRRGIGSYLFLRTQFAFFDFEEPLARFLLDYLAVMWLFALIGYLTAECLRRCARRPGA